MIGTQDLRFKQCMYCDYPKKEASGTSFTEIMAEGRGMEFNWLRNHIKETHPDNLKEFMDEVCKYLKKKNRRRRVKFNFNLLKEVTQ